jgi:hypothetical protein
MYRKRSNGQISIEEFHLPFGGSLDPDNRWVQLDELMPWEHIEEVYAAQFNATLGAPAKSGRVAFGALYIKQKLGLTDEETVHQIRENAYIQYFLGFSGRSSKAPFDPSMMVHFRKRFSDHDLRRINELVVQHGKEQLLDVLAQTVVEKADDDESELGDSNPAVGVDQLELDQLIKPIDWPEGQNWGTLTIDASCTPVDIAYPRDLALLNEARVTTEAILDHLSNQSQGFRQH